MRFLITIIGKPGSGKSTFIRLLSSKFQSHEDYRIQVFNDRDILVEMAHQSDSRHLIRPLDAKNFEIVDDAAYDIAIDRLISRLRAAEDDEILLTEFSRNGYVRTLQRFGDLFSDGGSIIVYLDTPFDVCKERNIKRAILSQLHTVPSDEMESYFKTDDIEQLKLAYPSQVVVLKNELEVSELVRQLEEAWPTLRRAISQRKNRMSYKRLSE